MLIVMKKRRPFENPLIAEAIEVAGSQERLADLCKVTQPAISKALGSSRVSADLAVAIERATGGAVPRWRLRPDLWSQPTSRQAFEAGAAA